MGLIKYMEEKLSLTGVDGQMEEFLFRFHASWYTIPNMVWMGDMEGRNDKNCLINVFVKFSCSLVVGPLHIARKSFLCIQMNARIVTQLYFSHLAGT